MVQLEMMKDTIVKQYLKEMENTLTSNTQEYLFQFSSLDKSDTSDGRGKGFMGEHEFIEPSEEIVEKVVRKIKKQLDVIDVYSEQ